MDPLEILEDRLTATLGQLGLDGGARPGHVTALRSEHGVILVHPFSRDDRTWVRITALVLVGFEPNLGLLQRVLQTNNVLREGGLRLFEDRTLAWSTTLQGESLDADTFSETLRYAGWVADTTGPELKALAGGLLGADLLRSPSCATC